MVHTFTQYWAMSSLKDHITSSSRALGEVSSGISAEIHRKLTKI